MHSKGFCEVSDLNMHEKVHIWGILFYGLCYVHVLDVCGLHALIWCCCCSKRKYISSLSSPLKCTPQVTVESREEGIRAVLGKEALREWVKEAKLEMTKCSKAVALCEDKVRAMSNLWN